MWEIDWITDWPTIESVDFRQHWLNTFHANQANHVFFHPEIVTAWISSYRSFEDISPLFCIAKSENIDLILPLVLWKRNYKYLWQKLLIPIGYSEFDYHDPITSRIAINNELSIFWSQLFDHLPNKLKYDEFHILGIRNPGSDIGWSNSLDRAPYIDLKYYENYEQFLKKLKSNLRVDLLRQKRKLLELGDISFKIFGPNEHIAAEHELKAFLMAHQKKWPNAFHPPNLYQNLINIDSNESIIHYSTIKLGTRTISWHLGFISNRTFYYYMHAFDSDYSNFSPGKIHLFNLIEYCFENKISKFDYLIGEEGYKNKIMDGKVDIFQISIKNNNLGSRLKRTLASKLHQLYNLYAT